MAKSTKPKGQGGIQNRPVYARVSFLYQAAALLATQQEHINEEQSSSTVQGERPTETLLTPDPCPQLQGFSRRLVTDLRSVSLKTQIRICPAIKQTICKFCDTLLVQGKSCTSVVENKSKGGRKSWADVLVIKCGTCGREKRYPVSAQRQKRRPFRSVDGQDPSAVNSSTVEEQKPSR